MKCVKISVYTYLEMMIGRRVCVRTKYSEPIHGTLERHDKPVWVKGEQRTRPGYTLKECDSLFFAHNDVKNILCQSSIVLK